jgi:hypothetical protein
MSDHGIGKHPDRQDTSGFELVKEAWRKGRKRLIHCLDCDDV